MIGKVGKKGEIYIPKKVREAVNLKPGDEITIEVREEELIIKKKRDVFDVLMEDAVSKVTVNELRDIRDKLSRLLI